MTDLASTGLRLVPKQLKDELTMAKSQLTKKGVTIGIGAGIAIVGLAFLFVMVVALIVALIGGLAQEQPIWFWALMVAVGALVLALIFLLIGALRIKAAMPLVPAETVRGFKHDLGYLKEGNAFNPAEFDRQEAQRAEDKKAAQAREAERRKQAEKENKEAAKRGEAPKHHQSSEPSYEELRRRTQLRRQHLGDIRSGLEEKTDVKSQVQAFTSQLGRPRRYGALQAGDPTAPTSPYSTGARAGEKANEAGDYVKERWQPLALLGASTTALAVFARQLGKK
ncbi:phage holin family protein [Micrococcus terreus]|uniref:phage holin family protein n=1 Tax=Micrococcus terreus TaxID=574650 RepID=UPI0021A527D5|nr:phage holin family protein [Micrococcus terreus]MCT2089719.1 phage holin family protein [Micrococcus terreus]